LPPREGATPEVARDDEELVLCPEEPDELWPPEELDELEKVLLWEDPELEEALELEPPEEECCAKTAEVNTRVTAIARLESLIKHLPPFVPNAT
jgi:hypothetical protein